MFCNSVVIDSTPSSSGGGGSGSSSTSTENNNDGEFDPNLDAHGGGITAPLPDLEEENEEETPCEKISEQLSNSNFQEKEEIIKNSFNESEETGFSETADGVFNQLAVNNGGHALELLISNNMIGYLHSHINSYEGTDVNGDGIPDLIMPIKMFSPSDLIKFLELLENANNNNIPLIDIYGSMYSSYGNYTLKFTGDINSVLSKLPSLRYLLNSGQLNKKYKEYFDDFNNKEKAFLNFLKNEIGVDGIGLFKLKGNGVIKEKTLNSNGNVNSQDC